LDTRRPSSDAGIVRSLASGGIGTVLAPMLYRCTGARRPNRATDNSEQRRPAYELQDHPRSLTLLKGPALTVKTSALGYNPFDDTGCQKIGVGDRVSASGALDARFFGGRVLEADAVITLLDADKPS
jgi:hypothetical protein